MRAKEKVAKDAERKLNISSAERINIAREIDALTTELNHIVKMDAMNTFFREHPRLAEKAYIKLYGEMEDVGFGDMVSTEEDFLGWIHRVGGYTEELLAELDEAINY